MDLGAAQHFVGSHFNLMKTFSNPSTCCQAGAPRAEEPNNSAWGAQSGQYIGSSSLKGCRVRSDERQFPAEEHRHRCQSLTQLWINLNPRALLCQLDSSYHGSGCEEGRKARCRPARCWAALSEGFLFLISQQNDSYAMRLLPLFLLATGASATCQRDPRGGGNLGRSKKFCL